PRSSSTSSPSACWGCRATRSPASDVTGGPARAASRRRWRGALRAAAPALAGLVLGVAALGPALGPGFVLRYDMVVAPDPPLAWPAAGGFPRAVPSDLIFAAAAR